MIRVISRHGDCLRNLYQSNSMFRLNGISDSPTMDQ